MSDEMGWYADPKVPGQSRWWDGSGWTPRTMLVPDASAPPVVTLPSRPERHIASSINESTSVRILKPRTAVAVLEPTEVDTPPAVAETSTSPSPGRRWPLVLAIVGGSLALVLGIAIVAVVVIALAQFALAPLGGIDGLQLPPAR